MNAWGVGEDLLGMLNLKQRKVESRSGTLEMKRAGLLKMEWRGQILEK